MKITVTETTTTEKEVEITLPAFRREVGSNRPSHIKIIGAREYIRLYTYEDGDFSLGHICLSAQDYFSNQYEPITETEYEEKLKEVIERAAALSQTYYFATAKPYMIPQQDEPVKADPLP